MNREIKFRAWDPKEKKMYTAPIGVCDTHNVYSYNPLTEGWSRIPYEVVTMQYTGLKDKNGKEIYEGDIVDYIGHKSRVIEWTPDKHHYTGWYAVGGPNPIPVGEGNEQNTIEVIGNIHENPDLLKEGD